MSSILVHPTAMTLAAVEKLEATTGMRAVVTGILRVELRPRSPSPTAAKILRHQAMQTVSSVATSRDPDNHPTPPPAA